MKRSYDSTLARIAGNIASGMAAGDISNPEFIVRYSVRVARLIVAECERTEQPTPTNAVDPVDGKG